MRKLDCVDFSINYMHATSYIEQILEVTSYKTAAINIPSLKPSNSDEQCMQDTTEGVKTNS